MVGSLDYLYLIVGLANGEAGAFTASFASSVYSYQEVVAAAFNVEGDFPVVVDDDGAYVEAMWSYRCDGDGVAMRNDDRSANA